MTIMLRASLSDRW